MALSRPLSDTSDSVRSYLQELAVYPLLSAAQEVELSQDIEAGLVAERLLSHPDELSGLTLPPGTTEQDLKDMAAVGRKAFELMLNSNLRLVVSVAKRRSNRGMEFLDVVQHGNLGLIRAVYKFDYTKGYKFSTYAMWWIKQAMQRGLAEESRAIRLPVHIWELVFKYRSALARLLSDHGDEPTDYQLAVAMKLIDEDATGPKVDAACVKVAQLRRIEELAPISLDATLGDDGSLEVAEALVDFNEILPADQVAFDLLASEIDRALRVLPARSAVIMRRRYFDNLTLDEVGYELGLTRERIRQLESQAIGQLRRNREVVAALVHYVTESADGSDVDVDALMAKLSDLPTTNLLRLVANRSKLVGKVRAA